MSTSRWSMPSCVFLDKEEDEEEDKGTGTVKRTGRAAAVCVDD